MEALGAIGLAASVVGLLATVSGVSGRSRRLRHDEPSTSFGIEVLDDGSENPVADICFVHGLNEDRVSAWLSTNSGDEDQFWWPKTLQEKIHARILLYGYSTVAPTAEYLARRTLYHQAEHMVESLADSPEPNSPARAIVLSTAGIVFLGTPHKVHGYLSSSSDSVLKNIARVSGLNGKILDHLNKESSALQSYLEPFSALSTEIPMAGFFESRGSGSLGLIVSSSMAVPGTEHYFLDSNHANLGKFQGYDDHGYRRVASVIQEMCQKATSLVDKNWEKYQQRNEPNAYGGNDERQDDFRVPLRLLPPAPCQPLRTRRDWEESDSDGICRQILQPFQRSLLDPLSDAYHYRAGVSSDSAYLPVTNLRSARRKLGTRNGVLVLEWLNRSRNTNWLLIFDDVDLSAAPDLKELIPSTACVHGHVILTSRAPLKLPFAKMYLVDPLRVDESRALLKKSLGPSYSYDSDLDKISKALGGLPLALSMAAEVMKRTEMSPREYLEAYDKTRSEILSEHFPGNEIMSTILAESVEKIPKHAAKLLFSMCCELSLNPIPLWIFEGSTSFSSKRILRESISALESLSLIVRPLPLAHIQVHSFVRESGRIMLPTDLQDDARRELCETASYVVVSLHQPVARFLAPANDGTSSFEKELVELIVDILRIIRDLQIPWRKWDVNLEELGRVCQAHGKFSEATEFYELCLERNKGTEASMSRVKIRRTLAQRRAREGLGIGPDSKEKSLREQFQEAVEAAHDEESLQDLKSLNREQDDPDQELEVLRMIIDAQELLFGPMNPSTLESIQELSLRLVEHGLLEEAEARLRRVLTSYGMLYGTHHPSTTRVEERLASVCALLGKLDEAEAICKDAIHDYEMRLGRDHASTQKCLAQLAFTYYLQEHYEDAEPLFVHAIDTLSRTAGPHHPDVLRVQHNYALNLRKLGRARESEQLLEDVLSRMESQPERHSMSVRRRTAM
ncbi:Tetratricopeptide repeat-containing protein isoform 2 [Cladophialophora immunda]|nr:Tetratricopeptide repeat-containing protein isoform 1 [Cladophialophora immunda]OQU93583.1 Tetratricopeptide repeat-containing protein isoform 2 [Cladophialophora immunda]